MILIDDALSPQVFNYLYFSVFRKETPWFYTETSLSGESINGINDHSFFHLSVSDGNINSDLGVICNLCLLMILDKLDLKVNYFSRARLGLLQPKPIEHINKPHVDDLCEHKVGLLYLNDSDGDTLIYNERYDATHNINPLQFYEKNLNGKLSVKHRIKPKSNRFVMFDGLHYHSSTCPTSVDRRVVLNYNFSV